MEVPSSTNNGQHPLESDRRNEDGVLIPTPAAAGPAADDVDPRRAGPVGAGLPGPAWPGPAAVHVRHAPATPAAAGQRGGQGRAAPHVPHGATGRAVCGAEPEPAGLESYWGRAITGELHFIFIPFIGKNILHVYEKSLPFQEKNYNLRNPFLVYYNTFVSVLR